MNAAVLRKGSVFHIDLIFIFTCYIFQITLLDKLDMDGQNVAEDGALSDGENGNKQSSFTFLHSQGHTKRMVV